MSFFFTANDNAPVSVTSQFVKPRILNTASSGVENSRRTNVAQWRGEYQLPPQENGSKWLADIERADSLGGSFFADLYQKPNPAVLPVWIAAETTDGSQTITSFQVNVATNPSAAAEGEGLIVSFRSERAKQYVTARIITAASTSGDIRTFTMSTPLPLDFIANNDLSACFNRPHVRAKIRSDTIQWSSSPRVHQPASFSFYEDLGGNLTFLQALSAGAVAPGEPLPDEDFRINEEATGYRLTEDGEFRITDDGS